MTVDKYPTKLEGVSGTTEKTTACASLCNKRSSELSRRSEGSMAHGPLLCHLVISCGRNGSAPETDTGHEPRTDKDVRNLKHGSNEGLRENLYHFGLGFLICIPDTSLCSL